MAVSHAQIQATTPPKVEPIRLKPSPFRHEKESADGLWHFARLEQPGTPWAVTHLPSGRWLLMASLRAARVLTASGWVLAELDRTQPLTVPAALAGI